MKRLLTILFAAALIACGFALALSASPGVPAMTGTDIRNITFEESNPDWLNYYSANTSVVVADTDPISGLRSVIMERGEARVWNFNISSPLMGLEFKTRIIKLDGVFAMRMADVNGLVLRIDPNGAGGYTLKGASSAIADLEAGKNYTIGAVFAKGEDKYDIYLDGIKTGAPQAFAVPVNGFNQFRYTLAVMNPNDQIMLDDVRVVANPVYLPPPTPFSQRPSAGSMKIGQRIPNGGETFFAATDELKDYVLADDFSVSFDIKALAGSKASVIIGDKNGHQIGKLRIGEDGLGFMHEHLQITPLMPDFEWGKWQYVEIRVSMDSLSADIYVDGLKKNASPLRLASFEKGERLCYVLFRTEKEGTTLFVDNFTINYADGTLLCEMFGDGWQNTFRRWYSKEYQFYKDAENFYIDWDQSEDAGWPKQTLIGNYPKKDDNLIVPEMVPTPTSKPFGTNSYGYSTFDVAIDNVPLALDQAPVMLDGIMMIPARQIFEAFGGSAEWDVAAQKAVGRKGGFEIEFAIGSAVAKINGQDKPLDAAPIVLYGNALVPLRFVAGAFDATVTWDDTYKLARIATPSTVPYGELLRTEGGKYYFGDTPFAEISFNKYDLLWTFWNEYIAGRPLDDTNPRIAEEERVLEELRELGFTTLRVFMQPYGSNYKTLGQIMADPVRKEDYFVNVMDRVMDLLDKHGIKIVFSIGVTTFDYRENGVWVNPFGESTSWSCYADPFSQTRLHAVEYVNDVVRRYKNRKTVLMYETENELTLYVDLPKFTRFDGGQIPTLDDLRRYYNDLANAIHGIDGKRLVNNGGSYLRPEAWGLYTNRGTLYPDTVAEQEKAYSFVYKDSGMDVIDIHIGGSHDGGNLDDEGQPAVLDIDEYKRYADIAGKPLYIGEYYCLPRIGEDGVFGSMYSYLDPSAELYFNLVTQKLIDYGISLAMFWSYNDEYRGVSSGGMNYTHFPLVIEIIADANQRMKAKVGAPATRGAGGGGTATDALKLTTAAHNVKAGDYFTLDAAFDGRQDSNAAILSFSFDGGKFEYAGFTPAGGVQVMNADHGAGFARLTLISMDYDLESLGCVMLRAKEDAVFANEFQNVGASVDYAVLKAGGGKEILTSASSAKFTTLGGSGGRPALPGDTNFDGVLDLIDLSNMIDWFGLGSSDAQWDTLYTFFDFNNNGMIDISDIAYVAQRI